MNLLPTPASFPRPVLRFAMLALGFLTATAHGVGPASTPAATDPVPAALVAKARSVLHEIMASEQSWVKIHAAEALIDAGEAGAIRREFLRDLPAGERSAFRIGVWRVLANTAPSAADRQAWIARIEQVYCEPGSPDRLQAIETLGKLSHRVGGQALALVRAEAAGAPTVPKVLALWAAQLAGEPSARAGLVELLASPDPALRGDAAYAVRWLRLSDPDTRQALERALAAEPAGTSARPYLLGAALTVKADPARAAQWTAELDAILATGSTDARFEASQTLKHGYPPARAASLAGFLDLPPKENDARVGAAMIILLAARAEAGAPDVR